MNEQALKDKRGIKYGKILSDTKGNSTIYDKMNSKLGTIKLDSSSHLIAYDKMNRKLATYDMKLDATKDSMGRKLGKGNMLLNFFFPQ
ncbi:MAG TPA: hypothetical protein VFC41_07950 [Anaerovoracaceae bacterium]|nr:hypothetical protein [Anaerovoracaceae bacterium]